MSVLPNPDFGLNGRDGCVMRPDWLSRRRAQCEHPSVEPMIRTWLGETKPVFYFCSACGQTWTHTGDRNMTPTSTLHLACPTCACGHPQDDHATTTNPAGSYNGPCWSPCECQRFRPRQAELATERAGEQP